MERRRNRRPPRPVRSAAFCRRQAGADLLGQRLCGRALGQAQHPLHALVLRSGEHVAVQVEEERKASEGGALVSLNEGLGFSDAVREDGGLHGEIRSFVVSVELRTCKGGFQPCSTAQLVLGLLFGALEYSSVQGEDLLSGQIACLAHWTGRFNGPVSERARSTGSPRS